LSQSTRLTDGWTDRPTDRHLYVASLRWHSMQRSNKTGYVSVSLAVVSELYLDHSSVNQ